MAQPKQPIEPIDGPDPIKPEEPSGPSPIEQKYAALGGASGFLGAPTIPEERTTPDGIGRYRHYQRGSIYWTPQTSAHEVHGYIGGKWAELGW